MRPCRTSAARQARAASAGTDRRTRAHALLRQWMAPLDELERLVPATGDVLDLGCGNGLFTVQLALARPARRLHGVDISAYKIDQAAARARAAGVADRVRTEVVSERWTPPAASYDTVLVSDVLYLFDRQRVADVVRAAAGAVRPGGALVVKEVAERPRWKHRFGLAQEHLAVGVLRITKGSELNPVPLPTVVATLEEMGWDLRQVPLDRGYPYSHAAVVAHHPS